MMRFLITRCFAAFDITIQVLLVVSNLGIYVWNALHPKTEEQFLPEIGMPTLYIGVVSGLVSLEMDLTLLMTFKWLSATSLYWWSIACLVFGLISWAAYLMVAIWLHSLIVGVWAFAYLNNRVTLIMSVRADAAPLIQAAFLRKKEKDIAPNMASAPDVETGSPEVDEEESSKKITKSTCQPASDIESGTVDSVDMGGGSLNFCAFLTKMDEVGPDHYIARDVPVMHANEESLVEEVEVKTKL